MAIKNNKKQQQGKTELFINSKTSWQCAILPIAFEIK